MMHYVAVINGEEREVEIAELSPGRYRLRMNGDVMEVDARPVSDSTLSLIHDNQTYNIESESNPDGGENLLVRGHILHVEVLDLRKVRLRRAQASTDGPAGPAAINSPMPGKVVAVLVEEGQEVEKDQGLVVVEAMKMENELRAPRAGKVSQLNVAAGDTVDGGAALCVVE